MGDLYLYTLRSYPSAYDTMSDTVIKVEHLSKRYILSHQRQERYTALRDVVANKARSLARRALSPFSNAPNQHLDNSTEEFYALKDVSLEIKRGDRVGIIGRNGAGKSTLLKILSRITEPTSGRIEITGRVASLLEVGTGFHPELTGRENIFLNGAILGMKKSEIKTKFDEIVAFAEIEKFLDTPVKRYSSGMYVRLAFAVAAHLEPEILIVDEVLAVGDAQFQKKCLGKMEDVATEGRTVIFVSHNIQAVNRLCNKAILINKGIIEKTGHVKDVLQYYLVNNKAISSIWRNPGKKNEIEDVSLLEAKIINSRNEQTPAVHFNESFSIDITYRVNTHMNTWALIARVTDATGVVVFTSWDLDSLKDKKNQAGILHHSSCAVMPNILRPGIYSISIGAFYIDRFSIINFYDNAFCIEITNKEYPLNEGRVGVITPILNWENKPC